LISWGKFVIILEFLFILIFGVIVFVIVRIVCRISEIIPLWLPDLLLRAFRHHKKTLALKLPSVAALKALSYNSPALKHHNIPS
jgi:hypothetical protein